MESVQTNMMKPEKSPSSRLNNDNNKSFLKQFCTTRQRQHSNAFICSAAAILLALLAATHQIDCFKLQAEAANQGNNEQASLNYLLYSRSNVAADNNNNSSNSTVNRISELLTNSSHNHASDSIDLKLANSVWFWMRQNSQDYARQRIAQARPVINKLLAQANVSRECEQSLNSVLDRMCELDQWAMQMYNSFGDFPTSGLFEGTLTSMGSYHQCVNIEPNELIGKPMYCTYKFQPIIPKRPKFHNILAPIDNLANFTNKNDMFYHLAKRAQYYYYIKLRLATCLPSKCAKNDFELLGKQVAINTYLQFSGVSCLAKEESLHLDGAQVFAASILIFLASISLLGTLVHILNLRCLVKLGNDADEEDEEGGRVEEAKNGLLLKNNELVGAKQAGGIVLPRPETLLPVGKPNKVIDCSSSRTLRMKLLDIFDVLMHFSIIKNGKKLFDTSTSKHHHHHSHHSTRLLKTSNSSAASSLNNVIIVNESSSASTSSSECSSRLSAQNAAQSSMSQSSDISCVHGLRFWTISWIIFGHTMQYTEWAGFGRAYQVEQNIVSFFLHPLMNATFSVDTFFLISGLLTTYVTWSITKGQYKRFNKFAFLISRYLRLTPQVLLVILLFIVFPLLGEGPYWKGLIEKESNNCKKNWWVNALYLQAFIKQDEICNLVTWWLSIEMFYHLISIIVIISLLKDKLRGYLTALTMAGSLTGVSFYLHYVNHYPPNMLPTLLQRYEIWDSIVLKYFWTPYPHAPAYFVGLIVGYLLYNKSLINHLSKRQIQYGWLLFVTCYLSILFGTYSWNKNMPYTQLSSTLYYNLSQIIWSLATGWAILACAIGHGGWLNSFLSSSVFVPLGRATYMTYLSHMIIVMSYPAKMNLLIEPSYIVFLYIFVSNLILSYVLGIILTLVYESPILHLQKMLVTSMAQKFVPDDDKKVKATVGKRGSSDRIAMGGGKNEDISGTGIALYSQELQTASQQRQEVVASEPC